MRFSLKISVRSRAHRPWHRPFVSGLVVLATLSASGLVGVPVSARPTSPAETRERIDPQNLPALRSEARTPAKLDIPHGDFSNAPGDRGSEVGPDRSGVKPGATLVRRDGKSEIWDNHNGTSTAIVHAQPSVWRDRAGKTQAVDDRLIANGDRFKNASGPVRFDVAGASGDGDLVAASGDGWSLAFSPTGAASGRRGEVDGSTIRYRQIAPGMDLEEKIEGQNLKETIILTELPAPGASDRFRFPLRLSGLTPRTNTDGSIGFVDASGVEVATMPEGIAYDSSGDSARGTQASTPVHVALVKVGNQWAVDLSVDPTWLTSRARVAPLFIDPNIVFNAGRDNGSTHFDAFVSQANPTTNYNGSAQLDAGVYVDKIGYASYPTGQYNGFLQYDISAITSGHSVVSATWNGYFLSAAAYPSTFALAKAAGSWSDSTVTWNNQPAVTGSPVTGSVTAANQWRSADVTSWVQSWVATPSSNYGIRVDSNGTNAYLRLAAMEQAGQDSYVAVTFTNAPANWPSQGQLTPANGSSTMSLTPTLASAVMTDPDGDQVKYWFRLATDTDAETGQVVNSGWLTTPTFQVPTGVLQDGSSYYWKVFTWDGWDTGIAGPGVPVYSSWPPNSLKVDLRLGYQGAVMDSAGPVQVNLANGNVTTTVSAPSFQALGGSIGASYTYNSQAPSPYGLSGAYYNCAAGPSPAFPPTGEPLMVRQDTSLSFAWGAGAPAAMIDADNFCVRWSGYITVPFNASNWSFGADHDDGVRIYLNNNYGTPYLNVWSNTPGTHYGAALTLTGNQAIPITVDFYEDTVNANFTLRVAGPNNFPAPASWLSPPSSLPALSPGWSLSTHGSFLYNQLKLGNNSLVLLDPAGGTHEYRRNGPAWKPTVGEYAVVTQNSDGTFTVLGEDGMTYLFDSSGKLTSATTPSDDSNRAAPIYTFDGITANLTAITDPVTSRAVTLKYAVDPYQIPALPNPCATPPSGFDNVPPPGHLCQLTYPNGSQTNLFYVSGLLGRIADPGGSTTDFAYDATGRLTKIRDPLGSDKVATDPGALDNDTTRTVISYDATSGKATSVTLPVPNAGETPALPTPARTYSYLASGETRVNLAGLTPGSGFFRKVTFDATTGLLATDTDATNRTTTSEWNSAQQSIVTTDSAGLKATTIYDQAGRVTDTYGPAPASCFTGQLPNGSCTSPAVPRSTTAYDEGIQGLASTYWANKNQTGTPSYHQTGVGDASGALNKDWGSSSPGGLPTDNWSARFTGEILLSQVGNYAFQFDIDDGVRLYIDDTPIVDDWQNQNGWSDSGTFNNTVANSRHRIEVDYYDNTSGAEIHMYWTPPGASQVLVAGTNLFPGYGLTTSTTDADGKKTSTQYSNATTGPEYGLATATVADPSGLNLTTSTTYEAPGATSFLRPTSRTLPKGSATTVNYAYYGTSGAADDPVTNSCGITSSSISQAGLVKEVTEADPDGAGGQAPIKRQYVYDVLGRLAGGTIIGDAYWTCVSYDSRGRITTITDPSLITTTIGYGVVGQVITNYTDSSGMGRTIVAKTDLLGRPISYTDELGTTTRTVYDQAGRATASYRTFAGQGETSLTAAVFDDAGRPTSQTEYASGTARTTTFGYDTAGRSQTLTRPNGVVTTTTYDPNRGYMTGLSNKQGGTTEISPWTYTRSDTGRIVSEITTGRTRAFTYDGGGRLRVTNENSGATIRNYAYDANSNRCANAATCGSPTYSYDNADRITASPYASAYGYDAHGSIISTTGTSGNPSMKFGYDANDHPTITNDGTTTTVAVLAPSGRLLRRVVITNSTGVVSEDTSFGYDGPGDSPAYQQPTPSGLGWPVILMDGFARTSGGSWDGAKWVTTSNDSTKIADIQSNQGRLYVNGSPARATSQMTATADGELNFTYRFNERTNGSFLRVFMRASGASGANQMPNAYRLEVASGTSTIKLQKFLNSAVTDLASFTYTKDTSAQRVRFQVQGSSIRAKVWAVGTSEPAGWSVTATDTAITGTGIVQIAHSHSSGAHTIYIDDIALGTPSPAITSVVTTYLGTVIDTGGAASYPIINAHGDVVGTTNSTGTFTANPVTDEFGRGISPASRLGWAGAAERFVENPTTGIIRMGVRLYDPNLGRFLSVDPIEGGSANDYDYVSGDPVNSTDPGGTLRWDLDPGAAYHLADMLDSVQDIYRNYARFYSILNYSTLEFIEAAASWGPDLLAAKLTYEASEVQKDWDRAYLRKALGYEPIVRINVDRSSAQWLLGIPDVTRHIKAPVGRRRWRTNRVHTIHCTYHGVDHTCWNRFSMLNGVGGF